jgi:hypothetical protein
LAEKLISLFNLSATIHEHSDWQVLPVDFRSLPERDGDVKRLYTETAALSMSAKNEFRRTGTAPAVYIQAHCDADTGRDQYVKELMEHMEVDAMGQCLNNKAMPKEFPWQTLNDASFIKFVSRYKFSLAFENCECEDYVRAQKLSVTFF